MTAISNIAEFKSLTLAQKFEFFDSGINQSLNEFSNQQIHELLKNIILDKSENSNIRKHSVSLLTDCVLLNRIKIRQALNILIDDWHDEIEVFLEVQRLKDLFFYYSEAGSEIENIYNSMLSSEEAELSSEASYNLGLIKFQNFLSTNSEEEKKKFLDESHSFLEKASSEIENREDSLFFLQTVSIIKNVI